MTYFESQNGAVEFDVERYDLRIKLRIFRFRWWREGMAPPR